MSVFEIVNKNQTSNLIISGVSQFVEASDLTFDVNPGENWNAVWNIASMFDNVGQMEVAINCPSDAVVNANAMVNGDWYRGMFPVTGLTNLSGSAGKIILQPNGSGAPVNGQVTVFLTVACGATPGHVGLEFAQHDPSTLLTLEISSGSMLTATRVS